MKLSMKHRGINLIIIYSNGDSELTLTSFKARLNFVTQTFIQENVAMMDSLKFIAACDLKVD